MMTFVNQIELQGFFAEKYAEHFNMASGIWFSFVLNFLFPH